MVLFVMGFPVSLGAQETPDKGVSETRERLDKGEKAALTPTLKRPPYNPKGKRDPFKPFIKLSKSKKTKGAIKRFVPPIKRYALRRYKLVGVMWVGNDPRAMVVDPEKNTYYMSIGDAIGNLQGKIVDIRENGIQVEETTTREDIFGAKEKLIKKSVLAFAKKKKGK